MRGYTISMQKLSWPQRVLYAVLGLALLVLAFFFLTVALVAGALVAMVVLARLWWISRKLGARPADDTLEGEFRIVSRNDDESDRIPRN